MIRQIQRFVSCFGDLPGCDYSDFSAVFVVLIEGWPLGNRAIDRAAAVVRDAWRVCHNRDTCYLLRVLGGERSIASWSEGRSLCYVNTY